MISKASRATRRQGGFTLVELMTVVAIIGIMAGLGLVYIDSGTKGRTAQGFAESLEAQYEMARARAVASQKRQMIQISPTGFTHWQYIQEGLGEDTANTFLTAASWDFVGQSEVPQGVRIDRVDAALHFDAAVGDSGLIDPATIHVLPDGRARSEGSTDFFEPGWTVFITDDKIEVRTLLFAVTGTASTVPGW